MKVYESDLNLLGKIPVLQQVSGVGRIIYGASKVIKHFKSQDVLGLQEYERGKSYIGRGLVEIIPLISTIALGLYDFLEQYPIKIGIYQSDKPYKFNLEVWKILPSRRHLFDLFEKGEFFRSVNQEESPQDGQRHLVSSFGAFKS